MIRSLALLGLAASCLSVTSTPSAEAAPAQDQAQAADHVPTMGRPETVAVGKPGVDLPLQLHSINGMDMRTTDDGWAVGLASHREVLRPWAAHWDGISWRHVPTSKVGGFLEDVDAISANDVWAVGLRNYAGRALIEHWDGTAFVNAGPSPADAELRAVSASAGDDVWAVGRLHQDGLVYHWNGAGWARMSVARPPGAQQLDLVTVSALAPDDVWAVGHTDLSGADQSVVVHWDGRSWTRVDFPNLGLGVTVNDIAGVSSDDVWAVGNYQPESSRHRRTLSAHWDGTRWSVVHTPRIPRTPHSLDDVSAVSPGDIWATGAAHKAGAEATRSALVEHWNGTSWSYVEPPNPHSGPFLSAVAAVSAKDVWCAGFYYSGPFYGFLAHWDGTSWTFAE